MDDRLEDMIRDIVESSYMKPIFMILYVLPKMCLYIRGARYMNVCVVKIV